MDYLCLTHLKLWFWEQLSPQTLFARTVCPPRTAGFRSAHFLKASSPYGSSSWSNQRSNIVTHSYSSHPFLYALDKAIGLPVSSHYVNSHFVNWSINYPYGNFQLCQCQFPLCQFPTLSISHYVNSHLINID